MRNDTLDRQRSRSSDRSERMTSNNLQTSSVWMSNSLSRMAILLIVGLAIGYVVRLIRSDRSSKPSAATAGHSRSPIGQPATTGTVNSQGKAVLDGMVWIPGGDFWMGSDHPKGRPDESPPHKVRISGFWINPTEVTNA